MPDIIHVLPDSVANQIAAGEVVQRPASVIKELVENAVDAGAQHIDIYVVDSGKTLIQVVDDGKGMSETDARMAFERHATSKIKQASDVYALHTMGFRGEAVPSIAAVSNVVLRTRQAGNQLGTRIQIEGDRFIGQEVDMCPVGANFSVTNLFFNVPARRAGLCNERTELTNIMQEFERMALVNPGLSFTFHNNGSEVYNLPGSNTLQRIAGIFGKKMNAQLLPVEVDVTICRISGFVGRPDTARKKGAHQFLFVNGRFMKNPYFHKAVCEAFEGLVPDGEQVSYFLYFTVDPGSIDVNISPSKTTIEFHNKSAIWQILVSAIKETLGKFNAVPMIDFDVVGSPDDIPVYQESNVRQEPPKISFDESFNPFSSPQSLSSSSLETAVPRSSAALTRVSPVGDLTSGYSAPTYQQMKDMLPDNEEVEVLQPTLYGQESLQEMEKSADCYQYRGQYIITAVRSGLMIIDQHRAHIRVLYNRYREIMNGQTTASQGLLFPEILSLSASDAVLVEEVMEDLHSLGFDLSPLGGGNFSVLGIPASLGGADPLSLLTDIVASIRDTGKTAKEDVQHRLALATARHSALSVGEVLGKQQMENLMNDLFATDNPSLTPDGKTVLTILPQDHIDKLFR